MNIIPHIRPRLVATVALIGLLLSCALLAPSAGSRAQTNRPQTNSSTPQTSRSALIVFGVSTESWPEANVDPIVLVERGRFISPIKEESEADEKRFAEKYFHAGQKYQLTFGGGEIGAMTIKDSQHGCNALHANGTLESLAGTEKRVSGNVQALATNSNAYAKRSVARRAPTAAERAAVLKLAQSNFQLHKVSAALIAKMKVNNLTAIEVDASGKTTLVGSFTIPEVRHLFLIVEQAGADYKVALANYELNKADPGYQIGKEVLVDHLDLDADGTSEIVTNVTGFDAYSYNIYRRQHGVWRRVLRAAATPVRKAKGKR